MSTTDAWPPEHMARIFPAMGEWKTWYTGDTNALSALYATRQPPRVDGVVQKLRRWFWGDTVGDQRSPQAKVHVPIAARICQTSAGLLFAEPPTVTVDDERAQARLDLILNNGTAHQVLASAAETAAALGGVYLRVTWDKGLAPHPFISRVDHHRAIPEFTWGRLSAVTFWREVRTSGGTVYRHLERHETNALGIGVTRHALHVGTADTLGKETRLDLIPETAGLADAVDADGYVSSLTPGLDVVYVPNRLPNRVWLDHPVGAHMGRSDLDGIEGLLDWYDETYSSWKRELRITKARIVAAKTALEDNGPGLGSGIDLDREVYEAINTPPTAGDAAGLPIQLIQPTPRVEQHRESCEAILRLILQATGYSPQTLGMDGGGAAMTATEVQAKERESMGSRAEKARAWEGALEALAVKALAVDAVVFGGAVPDAPVTVTFPPAARESTETLARTVRELRSATAASIETAVRMAHPDWSEDDVAEEVDRIREEQGEPAPDPAVLGVRGFGLDTLDAPGDPDGQEDPEREE